MTDGTPRSPEDRRAYGSPLGVSPEGTAGLTVDDQRLRDWRQYARNKLRWETPPAKPPTGWTVDDPPLDVGASRPVRMQAIDEAIHGSRRGPVKPCEYCGATYLSGTEGSSARWCSRRCETFARSAAECAADRAHTAGRTTEAYGAWREAVQAWDPLAGPEGPALSADGIARLRPLADAYRGWQNELQALRGGDPVRSQRRRIPN